MPKKLDAAEINRLRHLPIQQKLENGDWYQYSQAPTLQEKVKKNSQILNRINEEAKVNNEIAQQQLQEFLPHMDPTAEIYFPIRSIEYPEHLNIGAESFINAGLQIISAGKITVGSHTFIGPDCHLFAANHHVTDQKLRREGWQYDAPITIGNDCWLGGAVIVLPGVTIGDNVVIGAGSVVTHDIPSHSMAAGNPARLLKSL